MDPVVENSRQMIERGSRSFGAAARLFDPQTRESAYLLYAWCRYCDDCIDGQTLGFAGVDPVRGSAESVLADLCGATRSAMTGEHTNSPVFGRSARS